MKQTYRAAIDYKIRDIRTAALTEKLELHVLARAYQAAWNAVHGDAPEGMHCLPMLHACFEFSPVERDGPLDRRKKQLNGQSSRA